MKRQEKREMPEAEKYYRNLAREVLGARTGYYARKMGVTYGRISIREQKTRCPESCRKRSSSGRWRRYPFFLDMLSFLASRLAGGRAGDPVPLLALSALRGLAGNVVAGNQDLVNDAVGHGLGRAHEIIPFRVVFDLLDAFPGVVGEDEVKLLPQADNFPGVDVNVRGLALEAAHGLVDEDAAVGQGEALARRPGGQEQRRPCWRPGPCPQVVQAGEEMYCMVS